MCRELFTCYLFSFHRPPPVCFGLGVFTVIYSVTGCKYVYESLFKVKDGTNLHGPLKLSKLGVVSGEQ